MRRLRLSARIALAVGLFVAYTVLATQIFLRWSGMLHAQCGAIPCFEWPAYQWWAYLLDYIADPDYLTGRYLLLSGGIGLGLTVGLAILLVRRPRGGWSLRQGWRPRGSQAGPQRTPTSNYGNARWATPAEMIARWPGEGDHGGIVVGHACDPCLETPGPFYSHQRRTWGRAGNTRPLIDPGIDGTTHWMVIAPSGGFKSMCLVSTLLHWRTSAVVLDPKGELAPMLNRARRNMGHAVYVLDVEHSDDGFDVLDWIDISKRSAESDIGAAVEAVCGSTPPGGGSSRYFGLRGKALVKCLMAHMMWDPTVRPETKTLERLRDHISLDQDALKALLKRITTTSDSRMARLIAGPLSKLPDETFGGIHSNADNDTAWLTVEANAKVVSGNSFHSWDVTLGKTDVFLSLSLKVLQSSPALARCILWALLNAAYEADGDVVGRILFQLDEVRQIGHLGALKVAAGIGRGFGITLQMAYQSPWQIQEQWGGVAGMHEWFGYMTGVSYACVNEYTAAEGLSKACGTYGGLVWSESYRKGGMFGGSAQGGGGGINYSERAFPLSSPSQILNEMRRDTQIVIGGGGELPVRCARPLYFRNRKWAAQVDPSHFYRKGQPATIMPMPAGPPQPRPAAAMGTAAPAAGPGPGLGLLPHEAEEHELMLDPNWWDEPPPEK
jgi:type IV secretion system protein VirD4